MTTTISRRAMLAAFATTALQGCAEPLPSIQSPTTTPDALALLAVSASAHGMAAFAGLSDLSVRYAGQWRSLVGSLQPALVDAGFRGGSEERLLLREGLVAQAHTGPKGRKQVVRQTTPSSQGAVQVWFNGEPAGDKERRDAAALVADGYSLFLLGPMLLTQSSAAGRALVMEQAAAERIVLDEREQACDVLRVRMTPGLGFSPTEQLELFIDRGEMLMRRVRFTLNGLDATRGAIAEVDLSDHVTLHGIRWPTRLHERLLRPVPLPVHDWHLEGLDANRGLNAAEISGVAFAGKAAAPAVALTDIRM